MSENRIAASTPWRRTGCNVISQVSAGSRHACNIGVPARSARYSGSERPAWRMNHTGRRDGVPPRAATRRGAVRRSRRTASAGSTTGSTTEGGCMTTPASHAGWCTGAPACPYGPRTLESRLVADATVPPAEFRRAVAALNAMHPRPELFVTALDAPPRLAPSTGAFSVEADAGRPASEDLDEPAPPGRLTLLHAPAGQDAWEGTFRLVCFVQARLEREQLGDEMLPV